MKIFLTLIISLSCVFSTHANLAITAQSERVQMKIGEQQVSRNEKLRIAIENRLVFLELSDTYKALNNKERIELFERLLDMVDRRIGNLEQRYDPQNNKKLEVNIVLREKLIDRLENMYEIEEK